MFRYGKKTVVMLLLLAMLSTMSVTAAAEGEENPNGSETSVVINPDSGSTETPATGTDPAPSGNTGTEVQTPGGEQVVIILPEAAAAEEKTESTDTVTVSETGPGETAQTETTAETTPTPSPSPSPAAQPAVNTAKPTVTKHPTDETVDIGGECIFIANYANAIWAVWHFVSPDGNTDYRFDDKAMETAFPGLKVDNGMYSNMTLKNIPAELNGWRVCCEYRNNSGSVRTNYATVTVRGAEAALAAASPEPTPEPTPTPTPEAAPTPEASPSPTESPEESREESPKSTEKRSGSHTILMLAAGFALAAVVICGGILLIYRRRGE